MERRKCRRCGHPMTRMLTNDAGRWSACYTCLNCGYKTATVTAKSETAAEDGLERFMDRVDRAHEADRRSAAPTKPRPAEADRALAAYGLYCQLCEALTGKPIAKLDELLTAALHRAEPEMRPLTLEEIIAKLENKELDVVWVECTVLMAAVPMCPSHRHGDTAFFFAPLMIRACTETLSNYGKSWRCWPRKPTPEQMAAEKWEE